MSLLQRHVFICINARPAGSKRGCCDSKGAEAVRDAFAKAFAERKLRGRARANKAGCLDQCERGVAVVVYPEQVWYGGVTPEDVDEIMEKHVMGGQFVKRLMMPGQEHKGDKASALPITE